MYRGRLCRVSLKIRKDSSVALIGEEVSCKNGLSANTAEQENILGRWKPQAAMWHGHGDLSYLCVFSLQLFQPAELHLTQLH